MADLRSPLTVSVTSHRDYRVLRAAGILDATTYLELRNAIVKAALDEPRAVVVEATGLHVSADSAWAVFTSARWHVSMWPDIPVALVCADADNRDRACANGIHRYVPVFATVAEALARTLTAVDRRRARAELPATPAGTVAARNLVSQWLTAWSRTDFIPSASVATTVLMENAARHAGGPVVVRLESTDDTVTVAVEDRSAEPAVRHEANPHFGVTGLDVLLGVCDRWGQIPVSGGKTVWALIGAGHRL